METAIKRFYGGGVMDINLIYMTTDNKDEAKQIGKALINDRLAASK